MYVCRYYVHYVLLNMYCRVQSKMSCLAIQVGLTLAAMVLAKGRTKGDWSKIKAGKL